VDEVKRGGRGIEARGGAHKGVGPTVDDVWACDGWGWGWGRRRRRRRDDEFGEVRLLLIC